MRSDEYCILRPYQQQTRVVLKNSFSGDNIQQDNLCKININLLKIIYKSFFNKLAAVEGATLLKTRQQMF